MTTQSTTRLLPFAFGLKWKHLLVAMILYFGGSYYALQAQSFSENFDDITLLPGEGWALVNASSPVGSTDWFQGNNTVFNAYNGATTAYIGANFNNAAGTGTISNWLMSPVRTFNNGDVISFYTRTNVNPSSFPDRLRLMLSTNGNSTATASFTTTLLSVNAGLTTSGYPSVWTQYTATLSGLPGGGVSGRFALWYDVTNAGPSGSNSDYIGIDNVVYTASPPTCPSFSGAPANVSIVNSTCSSNVVSGGSITAPAGTPCPAGSTLQYNVNNTGWTSTLPDYNQTGPVQSIVTRCSCDSDANNVSAESTAVTTAPGTCTPAAALDFDGANDVVIIPDAPVQAVGTNFTLETWFKSEGTVSGYRALLDKRDPANNHTNFSMALVDGLHATIFINHGGGNFLFYQTDNAFTPGNWYHYAVTYDGSQLRQYVNGIIIRQESVVITNPQLNVPIYIGRAAFNAEHFDGQMDETRIWNSALTQAEIQNRMNCELAGAEPGLIAYYDFNQGFAGGNNATETTLMDRTANSNNGTLTNFALSGSSSNWIAPGGVVTGNSCCPTFSGAPANVSIVNSTCSSNVVSGGSITAPTGTPCPAGSTLQYNVNNSGWTSTLPGYNQTGPAQSIVTRCSCDSDANTVSAESTAVTTVPGSCSPANDLCANAAPISCGTTISSSNINATAEPGNFAPCGVVQTTAGVWYTFTGDGSTVTLSTCSAASFDTKISVYTDGCATPTCVTGNDDACPSGRSTVTFIAANGTVYLVLIHGFGGATGTFDLSMTCVATCPTFSGAPANVSIVNSSCGSGCTLTGGSITAPTGMPCPAGSTLQYNVDNSGWTTTLPDYNQSGPAQSIRTRCSCDNDANNVSAESNPVSTMPGTLANPVVPANGAATVTCPASATQPTPPVITACDGSAITPTGPVVTNDPSSLTCEGTRTYTWTYSCGSNFFYLELCLYHRAQSVYGSCQRRRYGRLSGGHYSARAAGCQQ
jgi:hypothetical protein